ncbi:Leucine-rich repeat-containing protein 37A3 [Fukomys damarensis]|uniref:Leucine-rich repeat-containing protein 37A3 n=1 Tax=Fukomys damarensis TaxID=885580 RepID=A0A091DUW0_FUKDA|nr:Leucine-rich repeat-containing protein 37A3 [Fukomys damarensis]
MRLWRVRGPRGPGGRLSLLQASSSLPSLQSITRQQFLLERGASSLRAEAAAMGNVEGALMKALQARKESTSTQLTIEPEASSPQQSVAPWSGFVNEQLDFHDERDLHAEIPTKPKTITQGVIQEYGQKCLVEDSVMNPLNILSLASEMLIPRLLHFLQ